MTRERATVERIRPADENHAVLSVKGGVGSYRRKPCQECPWRRENAGSFPAEAFRHSAETAYDSAMNTFACHMTPAENPSTCAGMLLRNAGNNLAIRIRSASGKLDMDKVHDDGADLFDSYAEMAIANGVDPDDERLQLCRADGDFLTHGELRRRSKTASGTSGSTASSDSPCDAGEQCGEGNE